MDNNSHTSLNVKGHITILNLRIVTAVVSDFNVRDINSFKCAVVTSRTEGDFAFNVYGSGGILNFDTVEVVAATCNGDCNYNVSRCCVNVSSVIFGILVNFVSGCTVGKSVIGVTGVTLNCKSCACVKSDTHSTFFNLGVVTAVIINGDTGKIDSGIAICPVTSRTECHINVFSGLCIGSLEGNLNGNCFATEGEYYVVFACYCIVNCCSVNCVVGNYNYGVVGVVCLNNNAFKRKLVAYNVILIHAFNLNFVESSSLGSFFIRIDDDLINVRCSCCFDYNLGSLCKVNAEGVCCIVSNTVDCVETVVRIGDNCNKSTSLNIEDNLRACIELGVRASSSKLTLCSIDCEVTKGADSALNVICVSVGCAFRTFLTVEVVVFSVVNYNFCRCGVPRIKVCNLTVAYAEDSSEICVESSLFSCEHSHTCNRLCDSACACIVVLYELNGFCCRKTVHSDVTLVFVCAAVACGRDMSAQLGVNNCNCSVCAPGTTDSGLALHNAFVCCELTAIEDRAVKDRVSFALVRALEGCDVACCAVVILNCVDYVDCTVLEVCCIVTTEDEVGVTGDEYVFKVLTACEELESILDTKES